MKRDKESKARSLNYTELGCQSSLKQLIAGNFIMLNAFSLEAELSLILESNQICTNWSLHTN